MIIYTINLNNFDFANKLMLNKEKAVNIVFDTMKLIKLQKGTKGKYSF
jgi:hypothetical protein